MPVCTKCHLDQPIDAFIKNRSHTAGHNPSCKTCDSSQIYKRAFAERGGPLTDPKRCPQCGLTKDYTEFTHNPRNKDGLSPYCRSCTRTRSKQLYYRTSERAHREPEHIRFWRKVDCTGGQDACWVWEGVLDENGYGWSKHTNKGKGLRAHRVAWEMVYGDIPKGMQVLHRCDVPQCVRPDHLFLGSQEDNMQDCSKKKRMPHPRRVLTPDDVRRIRSLRGIRAGHLLAKEYGVTRACISSIWTNRIWKDVT